MTLTYAKPNQEPNVYRGEIESTKDDLVTMMVTHKDGVELPLVKGKPQFRSFARVQILEMRDANGHFISKEATL